MQAERGTDAGRERGTGAGRERGTDAGKEGGKDAGREGRMQGGEGRMQGGEGEGGGETRDEEERLAVHHTDHVASPSAGHRLVNTAGKLDYPII